MNDDQRYIQKELNDINVKLGIYNTLLDQHIRRTEALEEQIEKHGKIYNFMEISFKVVVMTGIVVTICKAFGLI